MHFTKIFYVIHIKCFFGVFLFFFFKFTHSSTTTKLDAVNLKFFLLPKESPSALWVQIHWLHKPVDYAHCCWRRVSCVTRVYAVVHAAFGQQGGDRLQLLTCRSHIGTQDLLIIWTCKESHPFQKGSRCCISTNFGNYFTVFWASALFQMDQWIIGPLEQYLLQVSLLYLQFAHWVNTQNTHHTRGPVENNSPIRHLHRRFEIWQRTGYQVTKEKTKRCNAHHIMIF